MVTSTAMFKMTIAEVFRFQDGTTVLVGPIMGTSAMVRACTCELLVDGVRRQEIRIEGEMMPSRPHEQGHRSVSSKDVIQLERGETATSICVLQPVA